MACEYCKVRENRDHVRRVLGSYMTVVYCPRCGENMAIVAWFYESKQAVEDELAALIVEQEKSRETVEIDGVELIVERVPSIKKTKKPMDMAVDLDKIDISRELEIMEKHYPGSKQRLQEMMFEGETKC